MIGIFLGPRTNVLVGERTMKDLPLTAKVYLLGLILLAILCLIPTFYGFRFDEFWLLAALCLLASFTQIFKVHGATEKSSYNVSWILYGFSWVLFGVPQTVIIIIVSHLLEWIWYKYKWSIQLFNISSHIVVATLTSLTMVYLKTNLTAFAKLDVPWILASLGLYTLLNHLIVGLVIKFARGQGLRESGVMSGFSLMIDFTLLCLGAASAYVWGINPVAVILNVIPLYLIYKTLKVPALQRKTDLDQKTGLYNTKFFSEAVEKELSRSNRFGRPLTVVMADLDFLRKINNTYGHLAGDEVIIGLANILKSSFREYDIVSRFGGEEYAILLPETNLEEAVPKVEAIRRTIANHAFEFSTSTEPIQVTMSFGLAEREGDSQTKDQILHNADKALYHAKKSGRNRVSVHWNGNGISDLEMPFDVQPPLANQTNLQSEEMIPVTVEQPILEDKPEQKKPTEDQTPPKTSQTSRHPRRKVKLFVSLIAILAMTLFAFTLWAEFHVNWYGLLIFTALAMFAEGLSIDIYVKDSSVSTASAPFIAALLLYGPMSALVVGFGLAIAAWMKNRRPLHRLIFNVSNQMLGGLICTLVLLATREQLLLNSFELTLFICSLVCGGILFFITTGLISVVISLDKGVSPRGVWVSNFLWLGPIYTAMGALGYALMNAFVQSNLLGVITILAPLLVLRLSQIQYLDRTRALVKRLQSTNKGLEISYEEINSLNAELLEALADVIDLRDPFVLGHSQEVARNARRFALEMGLPAERIDAVYKAGLLHDLGKIGIPDEILQKPGMLTREEFEIIKEHPEVAAEVVGKCHSLQHLVPIIRHHHEKFDGTGYPDGLIGEEIPIESRILSMADVVEAMSSDRPYRIALEPHRIIEEVKLMSGDYLDPDLVEVFLRLAASEGQLFFKNSAVDVCEKLNGGGDNMGNQWIRGFANYPLRLGETRG
jgi:diguanylate cyclase (GGDEF)-like protein/putative nucleotidyltransferase with HDIG domain